MSRSEFYDLKSLLGFSKTLSELDSTSAPRAARLGDSSSVHEGRVGILPGSFNPPTNAHIELGRAAQRHFRLDRVVFSLSSVIVDKERMDGLCREDRLLLLTLLARENPWMAAAARSWRSSAMAA